jgi:glutamate-1-semialdehyde aminotransferase
MHDGQNGQELYHRAKKIIPGGTQLLSKRPEMFAPEQWPPYFSKARGCAIWDIDGTKRLDLSTMGIGSCILGYAHPRVSRAVRRVVRRGTMCTLNPPQEVALAELLVELHPWADMVRYARTGGEAMAAAIRLARAASGRDGVAFCGYHGWHDWYLAANLGDGTSLDDQLLPGLSTKGVPRGLAGTMHPFHYNRLDELEAVVQAHGSEIGVIVMEPVRYAEPREGFLEGVRRVATENSSVLVLDEITAGWRYTVGGAHRALGLEPDMAVFAKALGNGFPIAAIVGKQEVMEAAQETFVSSTYWTEAIGPTAALETVRSFRKEDTPAILEGNGRTVQRIWRQAATRHGLAVHVDGRPALCHFAFQHSEPVVLTTLLTQELLRRGFLGNAAYYASSAHTPAVLRRYEVALDEAFAVIAEAVDSGEPARFLAGPTAHRGFARLT